ncbi:MAG: C39 family peptidase, partial [Patescibacteria group bacterium]
LPTTSTNNQAQIISKNVLYKDNFENIYKIGYEVKIKNISKNTWLSESSEQVILKSKNDKTNQFPIFLPYDIKPNEYIDFKIIFTTENKTDSTFIDYLYLSKNNKEILGSGINVKINLKDIKKELPSDVLLDITPVEQQYSLNCESASLQMGLSYYNINKTQDDLIKETGFITTTPPEKIGNRIVWGDPDKGFVGNYNGLYSDYCSNQTGDTTIRTLKCATGWGVNNGPIAKNAKKYLKNSYDLDNASITDLKNELSEKNPIIFWEVTDSKPEEKIDIYTYNDWKKIKYTRTHVVLLIGYTNIADDTLYIFNDPADGSRIQLAEKDMQRIWERYDNNIVVLKK